MDRAAAASIATLIGNQSAGITAILRDGGAVRKRPRHGAPYLHLHDAALLPPAE
jgi:hypothetical protein